jgi:hypothetical protein
MTVRRTDRHGLRFLFWRTDFVGIAMVVSGLFFLLVNFRLIPVSDFVVPRVMGVLFILGGLIFVFFTGAGGGLSWFVIPAGVLFTAGVVALVLGTSMFFSTQSAGIASIGLGFTFLSVFMTRKNHWWALIPACTFFGLGGWVAMAVAAPSIGYHPVFLVFSVGAAFLVIYLYSFHKTRMRWSLFTGIIIVMVSLCYLIVILLARWSLLWPLVLVLIGVLVPLGVLFADRRSRKTG